jgi:hypothetical protein
MLKAAYRVIRLRSEDPVHLDPFARVAGQISKLELFLHASDGITTTALSDLHNQSDPRLWINYPISGQALTCLQSLHGSLSCRTENAIDRDKLVVRTQQKLQGPYGMSVVSVLDDGPGADCAGHDLFLPRLRRMDITQRTEPG